MFKKLLICILAIIGSIAFVNAQIGVFSAKSYDISLLKESFSSTGAHYEYSNVNAWAKLNDKFTTTDVMKGYAKKIMKDMNINEKKAKISELKQENLNQLNVEYDVLNSKKISIAVQSIKSGVLCETYILIDDYSLNKKVDIQEERDNVKKAYDRFKLSPKIAVCFVGTFDGQLKKEKVSSIVKGVMEKMSAVKIEGMEDQNVLSISAHTNKIKEYIEIGSEKINLNIAMRYSTYDKKTYIWVATPIIAMEY
ncbi:YwmB family TATA-box binding protein [Aceticella autotrophica]|uniref:YwmB family TATA-box binding protein n=1 Tax=Aceticella autotrophica TaxID=2755338 RepID=A0A975AV70_9THEO|nr:YwmB family TATA-box binding protein [Aceticella autotrophica]QSZ27032.1 YwmB family TATA-box binding protein [Aceticella autotrophica]